MRLQTCWADRRIRSDRQGARDQMVSIHPAPWTAFIAGGKDTEFGEKQNDYRVEFRVGYYF